MKRDPSALATLILAGLLAAHPGCGGNGKGGGNPGAGGGSGSGGSAGNSGGSGGAVPGPSAMDARPAPDTNPAAPPTPGGSRDGGSAMTGNMDAGPAPAPADASVPPPDTAPAAPPPWVELTTPVINLQGGVAPSAGGQGQPGGTVQLVSNQDIAIDPARPAAPAPVVPAVPADAVAVSAAAADLATPRSGRVGDLTTGGTEPLRTISASSGDLYIEGTLRAADLGAGRQGLTLSAPAGTVYVTGTVDTSGADGSGQAGGPITVNALRVVITGRLDSSGGDGERAGAAGTIAITAAQSISVTGGLDSAGGNARGAGAVVGGKAGDVTLQAGGDLVLVGRSRIRGGAAEGLGTDAQGGGAATLLVRADGAVQIGGILDARAGLATAANPGGRIAGGIPGTLKVGEIAGRAPATITLLAPLNASGGDGQASGGKGGSFRAEPLTGNVIVRGARAIDVGGGGGATSAGTGGTVFISGRRESSSAGVDVSGEIFADGGNIGNGGSGPGGAAGRIEAVLVPLRGAIQIGAGGKLSAVGGRSRGAAVAGGGGRVTLITNDGDLTVAGTIAVTGGEAPDPGGTGGLGGLVHLWTDQNGNANDVDGGNLLIATTGLVEASGGNGSTGGNARSDGIDESVAEFPDEQDKIAILVDCDNVDGPTLTWLENRGRLVARGGARNGSGGDVMFHGAMPDGEEPVPGNVDLAGNGTGSPGDFGAD